MTHTDPSPNPRSEALSAYLDGELTPAEAAEVEALLDRDASARAELDALAGARAFLAEHGPVAAPPDLLAAVLAAVDDEPVVQLAWYRRPFGVPVEALAVAAAALLVVWVALPGRPEPAATDEKGAAAAVSSWAPETSAEPVPPSGAASELVQSEGTVDPVGNLMENAEDDDAVVDAAPMTRKGGVESVKVALDPVGQAAGEAEAGRADAEALARDAAAAKERAAKERAAKEQEAKGGSGDGKGTMFARVPYSYQIATEDPQVLYRLAALAAKHRGEVTDAKSAPMEIEALSGTDAATVLVQLPAHALQAFNAEIAGLGSVYTQADDTMFAGDPVQVRVSVRLAGGGVGQSASPPNAVRAKKMMEADLQEAGEAR